MDTLTDDRLATVRELVFDFGRDVHNDTARLLIERLDRAEAALEEVKTLRDEHRQTVDTLAAGGHNVSVLMSETDCRLTEILERAGQDGDDS